MDNFIIGTFRENINLLYHNLHTVQDTIPKKLSHLTDVAGKWAINKTGDILPQVDNSVSLGSVDKRLKSIYVSDGSLHIVKHNAEEIVSFKFGISENNALQIAEERYSSDQDFINSKVSSSSAGDLAAPQTSQLLFSEGNNSVILNAVTTIQNTAANNSVIINTSDVPITTNEPGLYISSVSEKTESNLLSENIKPVYYDPASKEILSSDGSGHFTDLNVSGTIKGPAEFIIDPSPVNDNAGTVRIKGNLIVDGTQTLINSNVVEMEDSIVSIKGSNEFSSGIEIKNEGNVLANFLYDGINDKWKTNGKDLDLGTGNLIVDEVSALSLGNVLLTQNITSGETININLSNTLVNTDKFQIGIFSASLIDPLDSTGSAGVYLMTKIFNEYFYTVLTEKNIGDCNLSLASESGNLTVTGNNSGTPVQLEIKILNINKKDTV